MDLTDLLKSPDDAHDTFDTDDEATDSTYD